MAMGRPQGARYDRAPFDAAPPLRRNDNARRQRRVLASVCAIGSRALRRGRSITANGRQAGSLPHGLWMRAAASGASEEGDLCAEAPLCGLAIDELASRHVVHRHARMDEYYPLAFVLPASLAPGHDLGKLE